tara:strand:- start:186 stop:1007 length:822 start_codon:yes stop_codon:yes gene_type:complete
VDLTYLHGLGNDFLVTFADDVLDEGSGLARRLCDRTTGIGADGLVFGTPTADGRMAFHLFNSDGSRAEVSGNGLRCFGHELLRRSAPSKGPFVVVVDTVAGSRRIVVNGSPDADEVWATVEMGSAGPGPSYRGLDLSLAGVSVQAAGSAGFGNPHLVLVVDDSDTVDLVNAGPALEEFFLPVGCNVNVLSVEDRSTIRLRTWERGAGLTDACGSGACASAHLAYSWGLIDGEVNVSMAGGSATVTLGDPVLLAGPSVRGADYQIDPDEVLTGG